ncbi:MAG: M48 family metallopeptidase [Sphingomonadaceae bacterium]|nr:M48 family metallopeptidase [Sphingomonadaceae bacterium]
MRLRVDPRDGQIILTMPKRSSLKKAVSWVAGQRDWIEAELTKLAPPQPLVPGAILPWRGAALAIDWAAGRPRKIALGEGRLIVGGPQEALEARIIRWLKDQARQQLDNETRHYAEIAGVSVPRVSIGDARTRWGSCSSSGAIRYSWRLIMAPAEVLSATVAHEVAHRVHMDHSPAFHALVEKLFGRNPAAERRWLRDHGATLYRIGCSS